MRLAEWFQKKLEESKNGIVFITEGVIIEITEQIALRMKELGLKKKDLAERLGVSKAYVTRLLQGNHNMSIRKLVEVAAALGYGARCNCALRRARHPFSPPRSPQAWSPSRRSRRSPSR